MPVFIVSLFLPHTIHFHVAVQSRRPPLPRGLSSDDRLSSRLSSGNLNLLDGRLTPVPSTTPLSSNGSVDYHADFFSRMPLGTPNSQSNVQFGSASPKLTEHHTPAWGTGLVLRQPPSRAGPPPPSSILKHGKPLDDILQRDPGGFAGAPKRSRSNGGGGLDGLHVDSFGRADWTVETSDRVNGGLRNSIRAAQESAEGPLRDVTWVGTLGMPTDALEDNHQRTEIENKLEDELDCVTVWVKDSDLDGHYTHYCKQVRRTTFTPSPRPWALCSNPSRRTRLGRRCR